jgi:peptide methionine sulfoxide reductase msrA/msrB
LAGPRPPSPSAIPASTTLRKLLVNYWTHIDPTQTDGQFADIGYQYTSAIYYFNDEQLRLASESKNIVATLFAKEDKTVATEILHGEGVPFYPAEEYHQDYSQKNPVRYEYYKNGSGRTPFQKTFWTTHKSIFDNFLHEQGTEAANSNNVGSWKNFTAEMKEENLKKLTELQYKVSQQEKTEPPFENAYDKNYEKGLYVDVVSGEPLFLSSDKFDSGTGWPSFVKPINDSALNLKTDYWLLYPRTEVRSRVADSHLGHVFDDGPTDRGGKRYCMNSAAMRFIPLSEMESLGYGEYIELVK